jgi:hypothetical protein
MTRKVLLVSFCLALPLRATTETQTIPPGPSDSGNSEVIVPESVAVLVRPILDEKQKSGSDEQSFNNLLSALIGKRGHSADEALVVLMCFDIGESHEDAVIERDKRMLPLLNKYRERSPKVQHRSYSDSMLRGFSSKNDAFNLAVKAITLGLHVKARDHRS